MRALVQRVSEARVGVGGVVVGEIGAGLLVLLGVGAQDGEEEAHWLARKTVGLRVFEDERGRMGRSLRDVGGGVLCVSQFTLYGDTRRGARPSFSAAAQPELAQRLYAAFCAALEQEGVPVTQGSFGERMRVELVNDGPVTLLLER